MTLTTNGEKTKTVLGLAKETIVGACLIVVVYLFLGFLRDNLSQLERLTRAIDHLSEKVDRLPPGEGRSR